MQFLYFLDKKALGVYISRFEKHYFLKIEDTLFCFEILDEADNKKMQ